MMAQNGTTRLSGVLAALGVASSSWYRRAVPADQRKAILGDWYQNSGKVKMWMDYEDIDTDTPSGIQLDPRNPKRDFGLKLLQRTGSLNATPDPINRVTTNLD